MTHQNPTLAAPVPGTSGEQALPWMPRQEWVKTQPRTLIGSCGLFLDQQRRMLMLRYSSTEPGAGTWWLPGGMLDHGEDPRSAVRRETYEETGIELTTEPTLIGYDHRADVGGTGPVVDFFWYDGIVTGPVRLSREHDRHAFIGLDDLSHTSLTAHAHTLAALHRAATTGTVVCLREGRATGPGGPSS